MPPLRLARVVLDVTDMDRASRFWRAALGYVEKSRSETFLVLEDPAGQGFPLGLQPADEPKQGVSALHVELFTDDMAREARRLESLGASRVPGWPYGDDAPNWVVMRDPDGHELCVVQVAPGAP